MPNTYYVGSGGNNGNNGTTWALRKATLNGAEDIPVAAGDTVYVGPGVYRELLTCDVSGAGGSPITYIGDYLGTNTDGVGGVVRITGSDNDQAATRASCITGTTRSYRTFQGFQFDTCTSNLVTGGADTRSNWIINNCAMYNGVNAALIAATGASQAAWTIQNCFLLNNGASSTSHGVLFTHSSAVDNTGHAIQNCISIGSSTGYGLISARVGGVTVKNLLQISGNGVAVSPALTAGQTVTVNNSIFVGCATSFVAATLGDLVEDYNTIYSSTTARSNVNTGANSLTYPPLFDTRWFFQLLYAGAGPSSTKQVISSFDLSSWSQLINVAGTSPTTIDIRGTAAIGGQREWGALEYDSTLKIQGSAGGAVSISPTLGSVGVA